MGTYHYVGLGVALTIPLLTVLRGVKRYVNPAPRGWSDLEAKAIISDIPKVYNQLVKMDNLLKGCTLFQFKYSLIRKLYLDQYSKHPKLKDWLNEFDSTVRIYLALFKTS